MRLQAISGYTTTKEMTMSGISIGIFDPPRTDRIRQELEQEAHAEDRVLEIDRQTLASDGHVEDRELRSPDDVETWLRDNGVDADVAAFYAESVRQGHHVVVFRAEEDDEHFQRAARAMQENEQPEMQEALERWRRGERDILTASPQQPAAATEVVEERIPVVEEELVVGTREREAGEVKIHTGIEEEHVLEEVPIRSERVRVERRIVDRPAGAEDEPFREREVQVTERVQEPVVSKEARVVEEVVVSRESREGVAEIDETLRKTVVDVDRVGGLDESQLRGHFDRTYRSTGEDFEAYRPAYAFGYGYGREPGLREVEYDRAEPAIREHYEQRHGAGTFERSREAVRHGWALGRQNRR
jgi:stress response protein YsnF